uniref:Uncharacterized protein n=1 Tax=Anguilla anguilla TaxID=7936 RepID=A0A0E9Q786_ANGAN
MKQWILNARKIVIPQYLGMSHMFSHTLTMVYKLQL